MTDDEQAQAVLEMLTPGRTWLYLESNHLERPRIAEITEREILLDYFPYWCDQMHRALKSDDISEEACIEDFVMVHCAWEK